LIKLMQVGRDIGDDVPHHEHFAEYAPGFGLGVEEGEPCVFKLTPGKVKDENTSEHITEINERFKLLADRIHVC
jgi:hypothetical protein